MRVAQLEMEPALKIEPFASDKVVVAAPAPKPLAVDTAEKIPVVMPNSSPDDAPEAVPFDEKIPLDSARTSPIDAPEVVPGGEKQLRCSPADAPEVVPEAGLEVVSSPQSRRRSLRRDWAAEQDMVIRGRFARALKQRFSRTEDEIWFMDPNGKEMFKCKDRWAADGSVGMPS